MKRAALAGLLLLAACSNAADDDGGETLNVDAVGAFDPAGSRTVLGGPRAVLSDATQLGLVDLDASGQVVPGLASSWRVSDDGRDIVFRLRDARWQDGRRVEARDIVTVFRRLMAPASRHPLKAVLNRLDNAPAVAAGRLPATALGVVAPLADIVEIRLSAPAPAFLQLLADQSTAALRAGPFPPALGAFTVESGAARPLMLRRNSRYHDASGVALAGVRLSPTADPAAAIARFARGESDVVIGYGMAGLTEAGRSADRRALRLDPTYGVYGYAVNVRRGPLADPRVRRALSMAVDRAPLAQRLFATPLVQAVDGLTPPNLPGYPNPAAPAWADWLFVQRLNEARRLLTEAGFGPARPLALKVTLPPGAEHRAVLDAVARDWAALGAVVTPVIRIDFARAVASRDYQLALSERVSPADSARFFLLPLTCAAGSGYCNRQADRLLDGVRADANLGERGDAVRRAEQLMLDDAPTIPLFTPVRWALVAPDVSGWTSNILGAHPLARLDKLPGGKRQ